MKYFVVHIILFSIIFLISCASQPANAQAGGEPVFSVTTKNQDDRLDSKHENGVTTVDIHSPTGIGSARFKLESGAMPEQLILRLHLAGLEEFRLISDQTTLAAHSSSNEAFNVTGQSVIAAGNEYSITPIDPLWIKMEVVSGQADQKLPLDNGYFEITVPQEFIRVAGNSFEIQWIDFFR
jgi:hypothetical protein